MAGAAGFEPAVTGPKPVALPLGYAPSAAGKAGNISRNDIPRNRRRHGALEHFKIGRHRPGADAYQHRQALTRISHTSRPGIYRRSQPVSEKWARNGFQISDNLFARKDGELPENGGPPASHDRTV